ncbi:MAG: hypothetical protein VX764_04205 [Planctomycetota bacterium]|nr:hypothetical protein [Planctomycetota bacterium]
MLRCLYKLLLLLTVSTLLPSTVRAADVLSIDHVAANAGDSGVVCFVNATHDTEIEGFAVGIEFDSAVLNLDAVDFQDTSVSDLLSGSEPDFAGIYLDSTNGVILVGVIFGYGDLTNPPITLPASPVDLHQLLRMEFTVDQDSLPGLATIQFVNGLGDPPVDNILSSGGFSLSPDLVDGSITVNNLHRFHFGNIAASPGGIVTATLRYDHEDEIQGFQISLSYDNSILTLLPPADGADWYSGLMLDAMLPGGPGAPGGIELFYPALDPAIEPGVGLATFAAIFDFLPPFGGQVLPSGLSQSLLRLEFQTPADPTLLGTTTEIVFDDSYLLPSCNPNDPNCISGPALNYVIYDGLSITPILENGIVEFLDQPGFRRGNANGDANIDLGDALFGMNWLFANGSTPTCMDAADANDDSNVDISDSIYLLNYMFVNGPPPGAPGPNTCGLDPSEDSLDCVLPGGC